MRLRSPNNINSDGAIKLNSQKAAMQVVVIIERLIFSFVSTGAASGPHGELSACKASLFGYFWGVCLPDVAAIAAVELDEVKSNSPEGETSQDR